MALDPVCKMEISEKDAFASVEHEGGTYWFCSADCKGKFEEDPGQYTDGRQ